MIMIVTSFALVKFYAFAILYVLIVMQIKLVVDYHDHLHNYPHQQHRGYLLLQNDNV